MGDWGKVAGVFVGMFAGPAGNIAGWFGGDAAENEVNKEVNKGKQQPSASYPQAVDYSDATVVASENDKTVALAQIQSQEFQIQQSSIDRELQHATTLETSLESFDTKLQVGKLDFMKFMTAEENRHVEKMAADGSLPPPNIES